MNINFILGPLFFIIAWNSDTITPQINVEFLLCAVVHNLNYKLPECRD